MIKIKQILSGPRPYNLITTKTSNYYSTQDKAGDIKNFIYNNYEISKLQYSNKYGKKINFIVLKNINYYDTGLFKSVDNFCYVAIGDKIFVNDFEIEVTNIDLALNDIEVAFKMSNLTC